MGSLSFSPNLVSATNSQHTFTGPYSINAGDYLRIAYYSSVPIPEVCQLASATAICYSYPLENVILIKAVSSQSGSYSYTLTGMTNLQQSQATDFPYT